MVIMSLASWYIILTKAWDQRRLLKQYKEVEKGFWTAGNIRDGAAKLTGKDNAFRMMVEDGLRAAQHHEGRLTDQIPLFESFSFKPAAFDQPGIIEAEIVQANGRIVMRKACARHGAELAVDVYHALGVLDVPIHRLGLGDAWILGGGYKYLQLGEGNCFLRLPRHADRLRPVITGWFAEFDGLEGTSDPHRVAYGQGATRFAGSTYDPTSHYRASRVLEFFAAHGLAPPFLRTVYLHQVGVLAAAFDELGAPGGVITRDRGTPLECYGGFLALRCRDAAAVCVALAERGVRTDSRGEYLRFGPAPYLTDDQLRAAMGALGEVLRSR
jgi:hypothetical protein